MTNAVSNHSGQAANGDTYQAIAQGTVQSITTTASSQAFTALGANTNIIRIGATKACYVLIKSTATTVTASNGTLMTDGSIDYFIVYPGDVVTVIWASEAGVCNITQGE